MKEGETQDFLTSTQCNNEVWIILFQQAITMDVNNQQAFDEDDEDEAE